MENKKNLLILIIILFIIIIISLYIVIKNIKKSEENSSVSNSTISVEDNEELFKKNSDAMGIKVEGVTEEINKELKDVNEEFWKELKEYAISNGLVNYGEVDLKLLDKKQEKNKISLKFQVKDYLGTKLIAEINLDENTYEFYNYK